MKKWIALAAACLLVVVAWVGAGPYRTWHGIQDAVARHDAVALSRHIDFPALRSSLKAQLVDAMVRKAGSGMQSGWLGSIALSLGSGLVDGTVEVMVSPGGIGGLMQGREMWRSARESFADPRVARSQQRTVSEAAYHYESASRFTAALTDSQGQQILFVLRREGLNWKLTDIRLPLSAKQTLP